MFDTWLNSPWPVSLATNDNICSPNKLPAEKESSLTRSDHFDDRKDVGNDRYWSGMAER